MSKGTIAERVIKSRVKLFKHSPFFGTLLFHAPVIESDAIPTAATDGKCIFFNKDFSDTLDDEKFRGVLIHEVLHAALLHVPRMADISRNDPAISDIACDIVVNGICDETNIELPEGAIRDNNLKHLSVREIYTIIKQQQEKNPNYIKQKYGIDQVNACLFYGEGDEKEQGDSNDGIDWKDAMAKAATIARMKKAGSMGATLERVFAELLEPTIDWRTILYKYITESRTDFSGYDRRHVYNGLYLDDFSGNQVHVLVYIDVSGSIDEKLLTDFMSEIHGAINSVESVEGEAFCFDTELHHVCSVKNIASDFKLIGGGGTCFTCIFNHLDEYTKEHSSSTILPIILTDGYASFDLPTHSPLLWVIAPGGVDSSDIPFGDVVRISR
jgi:predicted metal-dependent peptidase